MYASNQKLDVSCAREDLPRVLDFAVKLYGENIFTRTDGRIKMAFAVVDMPAGPDIYLIGTGSMEPFQTGANKGWASKSGKGWTDYPFDYEPELVAKIIAQWAAKQDIRLPCIDGSVEKGIRVMSIDTAYEDGPLPRPYDIDGIEMHDAILAFVPYAMEYHK